MSPDWVEAVREGVAQLFPGYFALVMATGILSIGTLLLDLGALSVALFILAIGAHVVLCLLSAVRAIRFPGRLAADLTEARVMFSFFTFVAANGVVGTRAAFAGEWLLAAPLWAIAALAWLLLTYFTLGSLILRRAKPLPRAVNGAWLIAVVGTQSVAILTIALADRFAAAADTLLFLSLCIWAAGVALYVLIIGLIVIRLLFFTLEPTELSPPYWINMGAVAISTVAASALWSHAAVPFLQPAAGFLYTTMVGLWAWGAWWIPLLIVMGVWKHLIRRRSVAYEPSLWSIVFPLGMYTVATFRVAQATQLPALERLAHGLIWVALFAWVIVFAAMCAVLLLGARRLM